MQLSTLGEFGLIKEIGKWSSRVYSDKVVLGIGDDTAVLKYSKDKYLLASSDSLTQNVHFKKRGWSSPLLGAKSLAVNISDFAAMGGGIPLFCLINLGIPKSISVAWIKQFYQGLNALARKYGVNVVGGDTVLSPKGVMISITLLGEIPKRSLVLRSGAKKGDLIAVTGRFGLAASSGYKLLPPIRLAEGGVLGTKKIASAMIDSSDGLAISVRQICEASGVGARIRLNSVPVAKGASLEQALYGGEDYELVFTLSPRKLKQAQKHLRFTVIGSIVEEKKRVKLVAKDGREVMPKKGFEHFDA
ncbi:MAG: thiamine-phosphate kinase [Candidatus Saganbacteria bacterium]|nr:thiamine-phosphate kinase [Candidatus Saganbacteria bacterium]